MKLKRKLKVTLISGLALAVPISVITPSILLTQKNDEASNIKENAAPKSRDTHILMVENTFSALVPYIAKQLTPKNKILFLERAKIEKDKLLLKMNNFSSKETKSSNKLLTQGFSSYDFQRVRLSLINLNVEFDQLLTVLGAILAVFSAAGGIIAFFTFGVGSIPFIAAGAAISTLMGTIGVAKGSVDAALRSIDNGTFNSSSLKNDLRSLLLQLRNASGNLQNAMFMSWLVNDIGKAKNIVDNAIVQVQNEINMLP